MRNAVPEERNARPPSASAAAGSPGTAPRPSVAERPLIEVVIDPDWPGTLPADDPAVRRFWLPVLGVAALTDLLRLVQAARSQRKIRRPVLLAVLVTHGLIRVEEGKVYVGELIPVPSLPLQRRLAPSLRSELARRLHPLSSATENSNGHHHRGRQLPNEESNGNNGVGTVAGHKENRQRRHQPADPGSGQGSGSA
jgi:hypothetical protein